MTNKELRAQLLIEAADALEESAGRNGVAHRYREAKYENVKDAPKGTEDYSAKLYLRGWNGGNKWSLPESKWFGKQAAIAHAKGDIRQEGGDIALGKQQARISRKISDGEHIIGGYDHHGIDRYERSDRKSNHIHDTIKDNVKHPGRYGSEEYRAKSGMYKSKNESVADLLMEAAYMLMDDED